MSEVAAEPGAPPRAWARVMLATWEILAGYLLAGAPLSVVVWNDAFYAFAPTFRGLLMLPATRIGISSIGVGLLVFGAWDAAGLLTGRWSRR
jgi:hypothetical protein